MKNIIYIILILPIFVNSGILQSTITSYIPPEDMNKECQNCIISNAEYMRKNVALKVLINIGVLLSGKVGLEHKEGCENSEDNCLICRFKKLDIKRYDNSYGGSGIAKVKSELIAAGVKNFFSSKKLNDKNYPELIPDFYDEVDKINKEGGYNWKVGDAFFKKKGRDIFPVKRTPKGMVAQYYLSRDVNEGIYTTTRHRLSYHADGNYYYDRSSMSYNPKNKNVDQAFSEDVITPLSMQDELFKNTFNKRHDCDLQQLLGGKVDKFVADYQARK